MEKQFNQEEIPMADEKQEQGKRHDQETTVKPDQVQKGELPDKDLDKAAGGFADGSVRF